MSRLLRHGFANRAKETAALFQVVCRFDRASLGDSPAAYQHPWRYFKWQSGVRASEEIFVAARCTFSAAPARAGLDGDGRSIVPRIQVIRAGCDTTSRGQCREGSFAALVRPLDGSLTAMPWSF